MHSQQGISFIEILITLFLFSVFMLGFSAMQITSLRDTKSAYYFAMATAQLDVMLKRLYLLKGHYSDEQITLWNQKNHDVLPQGRGVITKQPSKIIVSIFWGNAQGETCYKNKVGESGCVSVSLKI